MSRKRPSTLFEFNFKRSKTNDTEIREQPLPSTSSSEPADTCVVDIRVRDNVSEVKTTSLCKLLDVGLYSMKTPDEPLKYKLLICPWTPDSNFDFPKCGPRNLKFQHKWLTRFPWLAYTQAEGSGALCKYCVLFSKDVAGKGENQKILSLVRKPFNKWKDAIEVLSNHSTLNYHKKCVLLAENFIKTFSKDEPSIIEKVVNYREKQVLENREKLIPIIEVIKLCGRQEIALRGTSETGTINLQDEPLLNEGNFRAILRMRANSGDNILKSHLENSARNSKYLSSGIQNQLISICGNIIQDNIVNRVNQARIFSVLADETTDVSRREQMTLCVRYVEKCDQDTHILKEDFLTFVAVKDTTGKALASNILESLNGLGIDCDNLVGQGYDGAAAMAGDFNGVQAEIKKIYPCALYVHCSSHSLNLAIAHSCGVQSIRNCIGTIKSIGNFIKCSAKRTSILQEKIKNQCPQTNWTRLTSMCETRWVENHDGLIRFKEIFVPITECLEELAEVSDTETSSKATQFLKTIISSEFVISLCVIETVFAYTINLCKLLQTVNCDLPSAIEFIENVKQTIQTMRTNIDQTFKTIFTNSENILQSVGESVKMPRIVNRQRNRVNVVQKTPEEYYRISVAIPFLDDFLNQLDLRFIKHKNIFQFLNKLLPINCKGKNNELDNEFKMALDLYQKFIDSDSTLPEIKIWQTKWQMETNDKVPKTAIHALDECNKVLFPNVYKLLQILCTLPVTTATPERSFSTLKRVKSYVRNSTGQERLTGLALMSTHKDIQISNNTVLDRFALVARRFDLVL